MLSAFSRIQQVLNTTTSADSMSSVATRPSATRAPARRSESCSFIWQPKVRMWKVRGVFWARSSAPEVARPLPSVPAWMSAAAWMSVPHGLLTRTRIRPRVTTPGNDGHMALATTPRSTTDPGLAARTASVSELLGALVADLDPDTLLGSDAASLYADFARIERLVGAAKTLLAPRIAASGHWEAEGHRSPAGLLAILEGGSAGQARRTLETGQRLHTLPSVEEALREGRLSGQKAAEIAGAATLDPRGEAQLLAGSEDEPLRATRERCQRFRATSPNEDPLAGRPAHPRRTARFIALDRRRGRLPLHGPGHTRAGGGPPGPPRPHGQPPARGQAGGSGRCHHHSVT